MLKIIGVEAIAALGVLVLYEVVCLWDKLKASKRHKPTYDEQMTKRMQEGLKRRRKD